MKRISIKVAVCIITFLIGMTAAAILTRRELSKKESNRTNSIRVESPQSLCDLTQAADRFESREVRVEANLIGFHEPALYSPECKHEDRYVRADLDAASREMLIQGVGHLNGAGMHGGNFWLHVILAGRFEKIAASDRRDAQESSGDRTFVTDRYRLVVSSVEKVEAVSDDVPWW